MPAERPRTAGEINAYADAMDAAARSRYPNSRTERIAWRCGWTARRNGEPAKAVVGTAAFGGAYSAAWARGWHEAGGAWGEVDESGRMPK